MRQHLAKTYPTVPKLADALIEMAINDMDCNSEIWEWLKYTDSEHYTRETFEMIARDILDEPTKS
jgi:hypothetical protein